MCSESSAKFNEVEGMILCCMEPNENLNGTLNFISLNVTKISVTYKIRIYVPMSD